ncbi:hypothetical protein C0J52_25513, partial [Blattella germanica]
TSHFALPVHRLEDAKELHLEITGAGTVGILPPAVGGVVEICGRGKEPETWDYGSLPEDPSRPPLQRQSGSFRKTTESTQEYGYLYFGKYLNYCYHKSDR